MSLFAPAPTETHLVEFNAGKCIVEGSLIKPDLRKGKLYMDQGDDQLLHLYWKERKNRATPEDNMIIVPEGAEFKRVTQCTTGRVYILKFKNSNESHFYWMQSRNEGKDEDLIDRANDIIRDIDSHMNTSSELDESTSHAELMRLLNGVESQDPNLTPENLLRLLNNMERSGHDDDDDDDDSLDAATPHSAPAPVPAPAVTAPESNPFVTANNNNTEVATTQPQSQPQQPQNSQQLDQLRQMLADIRPTETSAPISLTDMLITQSMTSLLNDPEICASLFPFLPEESERSIEEVRQVIHSPQFSQALQSLSTALQTGQLGPLLTQFGLHASAGNSVECFLIAIGEQAKQKKKKNNPDAMDED